MTNTNCLHGMQCPKCKSLEPFAIEITTTVRVFDDGTDDQLSDTHWDDESYCECGECGFVATVAGFTTASPITKAVFAAPERKTCGQETIAPADSSEPLLDALSRASFLLRRVHEGDHNALRNALDCADAADGIIPGVTGGADE